MRSRKFILFLRKPPIIFWFSSFGLSIASLVYLGLNVEYLNSFWPFVLAAYNLLISAYAAVIVFFHLKQLNANRKRSYIGSKSIWTLIKIVPLLTLLPVLSFYFLSFQNIQLSLKAIDTILANTNQKVLSQVDKLEKSTSSTFENIYLNLSKDNLKLIESFSDYQSENETDNITANSQLKSVMQKIVDESLACHLSLFNENYELIAKTKDSIYCQSNIDLDSLDKNQPYLFFIQQLSDRTGSVNYYTVNNIITSRYFSRSPLKKYFILSSIYPSDENYLNLLRGIEIFKSLNIRPAITTYLISKRFLLDFTSSILLTILAILAITMKMVTSLMRPLNDLSKAIGQISSGNYDVHVDIKNKDHDFSKLSELFNEMSLQIKQSREGLDTHNVYLETIVQYSNGVIALDSKKKVQFLNTIVLEMLDLSTFDEHVGTSYKDLIKDNKNLKPLIQIISQNLSREKWSSEIKVSFPEQNKLILCQGAKLRTHSKILGYLIVINDITELNYAQKKAAWGEVAMKMAHEVKNPLTPILLSADRLRNKFLDSLEGKDLEIMEKTTSTIIEQVKSMSLMVEAFSEFANTPKIKKSPHNLNSIINSTIELYDADSEVEIRLDIDGSIPNVYLDIESIKRVFINLVKNSKEANNSELTIIKIKSELDKVKKMVKVTIDDNGDGFDKNIIDKIFEPYATTKITGSGLGLAIVQNIVDQHNGNIFAKNIKPHGARIVIELPVGD